MVTKKSGLKANRGGKTLFNFCNSSALLVNLLIFIVCIIYIVWWYLGINTKYIKTIGRIISINDGSSIKTCIEKTPCLLEIEFQVNNKKLKEKVDGIGDLNKYSVGKDILILYNKTDNNDIILSKKWNILKGAFYIACVFLFLIIITSYLRIYHTDSTIVKWLISIECADTFFDII